MKGSAALLPNNNNNQCVDLLPGLGFGEGEIDIFEQYEESENDIVERYLQIARSPPYNLHWQTGDEACVAEDMLGQDTKRDIAKEVFFIFSQELEQRQQQGGRKKKSRRSTKKRTNKKKRSTRRRRYRRSRK
jgi:hypothetical protein